MSCPDLSFETQFAAEGLKPIGLDEVGRGCLAGPVVAAAVILPDWILAAPDTDPEKAWWRELNDSKLLSPSTRERLATLIHQHCRVSVAWCSSQEIDRWNILRASLFAMRRALCRLLPAAEGPCGLLVDGHISPLAAQYRVEGDVEHASLLKDLRVETLVKGDQRSMSIAAASIVAKVYRDRWMVDLDSEFPGYGLNDNKGYPAPAHYEGLKRLGPSTIHRASFEPVAAELARRPQLFESVG